MTTYTREQLNDLPSKLRNDHIRTVLEPYKRKIIDDYGDGETLILPLVMEQPLCKPLGVLR